MTCRHYASWLSLIPETACDAQQRCLLMSLNRISFPLVAADATGRLADALRGFYTCHLPRHPSSKLVTRYLARHYWTSTSPILQMPAIAPAPSTLAQHFNGFITAFTSFSYIFIITLMLRAFFGTSPSAATACALDAGSPSEDASISPFSPPSRRTLRRRARPTPIDLHFLTAVDRTDIAPSFRLLRGTCRQAAKFRGFAADFLA